MAAARQMAGILSDLFSLLSDIECFHLKNSTTVGVRSLSYFIIKQSGEGVRLVAKKWAEPTSMGNREFSANTSVVMSNDVALQHE